MSIYPLTWEMIPISIDTPIGSSYTSSIKKQFIERKIFNKLRSRIADVNS